MFVSEVPALKVIRHINVLVSSLISRLIYHALEPHKVLIFEDLCKSGYDVVRGRYLSEDEVKAVYRKVAKLHAVSYMLGLSENHAEVTKYQDGAFTISMDMFKDMMTNGLDNFEKMLKHYDDFHIYLEKFGTLKPDIIKASKDLYKVYELNNNVEGEDILVLNHGDFHMKNLMFKFNNDADLEDIIMVDYQISCYAPSTIDMIYSQYMILSEELRSKRHQLMQYYFTEFIRILKKIKCQGVMPKFSDFQIAALKYRHFTLMMVSTFLPMVTGVLAKTLEELKDIEISEFMENTDTINEVYRTPAYVNEMRKFLPILLSEGYFD